MPEAISRIQILQVQSAYEAGYKRCLEDCGKLKPYMSQKQAYDRYGRKTVERWIDERLIEVIKDGPGNNRCRIERQKIELVAAMSNRNSWFENNG